jgi:hypothetical protein
LRLEIPEDSGFTDLLRLDEKMEEARLPTVEVKIIDKFRGGIIHYREDAKTVIFEWEFGGSVTALIWGAKARDWDTRYPWAVGRQAEIYEFVAKEAIRQKSPASTFETDLTSGTITIR